MTNGHAVTPPSAAQAARAYRFEDMHLKVGDRLQLQPPSTVSQERLIVRLIGFLEPQCLLATAPPHGSVLNPLAEGDRIVVRVFSGQGAFGFVSFVDKIIRLPFEYLHLSFPRDIEGLMIRAAPRVRTEIVATAEVAGKTAAVRVANLSATGMSLLAAESLGTKGDELALVLPLELYNVQTRLKLRGRIRTVAALTTEDGRAEHQYGIELLDVQPDETLILQSVVHHELGRNPYSVV